MVGMGFSCLFFTGCQTSRYQAGGAPSQAGVAENLISIEVQNGRGTAADDYRYVLASPGLYE